MGFYFNENYNSNQHEKHYSQKDVIFPSHKYSESPLKAAQSVLVLSVPSDTVNLHVKPYP